MERFKEALAVRVRALGPEHLDAAATQYKMALVYEEMQARRRGDRGGGQHVSDSDHAQLKMAPADEEVPARPWRLR